MKKLIIFFLNFRKQHVLKFSIFLLIIFPIILLPDVLLGGRSLDPTFLYDEFYKNNVSSSIYQTELSTSVYYERPLNFVFGDLIKNFVVPNYLFNVSLGMPVFEQLSTKLFSPIQLLENLASVADSTFFSFVRIYISSIFIFCAMIAIGVRPQVAAFSSALIAASSVFVWFLGLQQMHNVFVALCMSAFIALKFPLSSLKSFILCVISLWLLVISGQPEVALFGIPVIYLLLLSDLTFYDYPSYFRGIAKITLLFIASLILALIIALPSIEPFINAVWSNSVWNGLHGFDGGAGIASPAPITLANILVFPNLSNYLMPLRFYPINGHLDNVGFYIGLPVLVLLFRQCFLLELKNKDSRVFVFLFIYSLIIILKNFGVEPFYSIGRLPIFDLAWSPRWSNCSLIVSVVIMSLIAINNSKISFIGQRLKGGLFVAISILMICLFAFLAYRVVPTPGQPFLGGLHYAGMNPNSEYFNPFIVLPSLICLIVSFVLTVRLTNLKNTNSIPIGVIMGLLILFLLIVIPRNYKPYIMAIIAVVSLNTLIGFIALTSKRWSLKFARSYSYILVFIPCFTILVFSFLDLSGMPHRVKQNNRLFDLINEQFLESNMQSYRFAFSPSIAQGNEGADVGINLLSGVFSLPPMPSHNLLKKELFQFGEAQIVPWYSGYHKYKVSGLNMHQIIPSSENRVTNTFLDFIGVKYFIKNILPGEVCTRQIGPFCVLERPNAERIFEVYKSKKKTDRVSKDVKFFTNNPTEIVLDSCWSTGSLVVLKYAFMDRFIISNQWRDRFNKKKTDQGLLEFEVPRDFCGEIRVSYMNSITDRVFFAYIILILCSFFGVFVSALNGLRWTKKV